MQCKMSTWDFFMYDCSTAGLDAAQADAQSDGGYSASIAPDPRCLTKRLPDLDTCRALGRRPCCAIFRRFRDSFGRWRFDVNKLHFESLEGRLQFTWTFWQRWQEQMLEAHGRACQSPNFACSTWSRNQNAQ